MKREGPNFLKRALVAGAALLLSSTVVEANTNSGDPEKKAPIPTENPRIDQSHQERDLDIVRPEDIKHGSFNAWERSKEEVKPRSQNVGFISDDRR